MDPNKKIILELPLDAVNFILEKLSERPFKEVNNLIGEIVRQSNEQIKPVEK